MSTRSLIGYKDGNKIKMAYCHFDGYLEYNGVILRDHYITQEQVKELIKDRNIVSLKPKISDIEYYEIGVYDKTFYVDYANDYKSLTNGLWHGEYVYVFQDGEWYYCNSECEKLTRLADIEIESEVI